MLQIDPLDLLDTQKREATIIGILLVVILGLVWSVIILYKKLNKTNEERIKELIEVIEKSNDAQNNIKGILDVIKNMISNVKNG